MKLVDLLKATIRPEFLNRIDDIILFNPLTQKEIRAIVDIQVKYLSERLSKNNIKLIIDNDVKDWIGKLGFDIQYGARPLKRTIQKNIANPLAEKVLEGGILPGDTIRIKLGKEGLLDFIKE